jgi:hypothetical protein
MGMEQRATALTLLLQGTSLDQKAGRVLLEFKLLRDALSLYATAMERQGDE